MEFSLALTVSAFIAGLLMFLAPCTLPLVPAYLAFITGVKQDEVRGSDAAARRTRRLLFKNALLFSAGFSVVFIIFGVLAGLLGASIGQYRGLLSQIGGVCIILFGLMMLDVWRLPFLEKDLKLKLPKTFTPGTGRSAFLIGAIFALGWTPCVGPVLASVLLLASTKATALSGALLLAVFSLGLSVPFILTALLYGRAERLISRTSRVAGWFTKIGGVFLILIGVLLLSDNFELTVIYGYRIFEFFHIDWLYNYL